MHHKPPNVNQSEIEMHFFYEHKKVAKKNLPVNASGAKTREAEGFLSCICSAQKFWWVRVVELSPPTPDDEKKQARKAPSYASTKPKLSLTH